MSASRFGVHEAPAFGTGLRIVVTDGDLLAAAVDAADRVVASIDLCCSRFREDSEITAVNRRAGGAVAVSPLFADLLRTALRAARITDGAVDPTVCTALEAAGYDDDFARVAADGPARLLPVRPVPGWRVVHFDPSAGTLTVPAGTELDFGATGKAFAADLAAARALDAMGGGGVLVSLGGDIAVAGAAPEGGWQIEIAEDSASPVSGGETVSLRAGGIATSSTAVRQWRRGAAVMHHIIDPATGLPASGPWRTVSVAAATCVDANIATTAAVVLGEDARGWLEAHGMPARLVEHGGEIVYTRGWPSAPRLSVRGEQRPAGHDA